jgi:hypothetical protein
VRRILIASLASALVLAAGVSTASSAAAHPSFATSAGHIGVHHGAMPLSNGQGATAAAAKPHLTYFGGPVVSNAEVATVDWSAAAATYGTFGSFFGGVLRSPYMSWLREYDTPAPPTGTGQHIGYGTFRSATALTPPSADTTVDDSTIQSTLLSAVTHGRLPAPRADAGGNVNTIYAVFFPHGDTVTLGTDASGVTFCAYHNATTDTFNGRHLLYMVLPDPTTGGMATGCGSHPAPVDNLESYTSHELAETITDPLVGLATSNGPPLAWYDTVNNAGEIADICDVTANPDGTTTGSDSNVYTVQLLWSNGKNLCIDHYPAVAPGTPTALADQPNAGSVALSWSGPTDDGFAPVTHYDVFRSDQPSVGGTLVAQTGSTPRFTDSALSDGTYFYSVAAENSAGMGPQTTPVSVLVDATKPTIRMSAPSSLFSLASSATTKYIGSDAGSGVASYDVSYRVAKWNGGFGSTIRPSSWQHTTATSKSLSVSLGHEYCFAAVARDGSQNVSNPSAQHCQVAPLDDRSLTRSAHWSAWTSSSAYQHTLTTTTTKGATLTLKGVRAHRLALVLRTCAKCGRVKIYLGRTLLATIDTHSASTRNKVVRVLSAFSLRTADVRLVAADAGKRVVIDGLGVSLT